MKNSKTIDQYITGFPESTQAILMRLRLAIKKSVTDAEEAIK